mgnify:CR=1 FL=1
MRKEQVVGLALRLFAIFLLIQALRQAAVLIPYLADSATVRVSLGLVLVSTLVPIAIAAFLWLLPLTIATKLIPGVSAKEPRSTLTATDIASVAFPVLGSLGTHKRDTRRVLLDNVCLYREELRCRQAGTIAGEYWQYRGDGCRIAYWFLAPAWLERRVRPFEAFTVCG